MLLLARKVNERIRIGENVRVMVTQIAGDKVRLGIEAPADVLVLREELLDPEELRDGDSQDPSGAGRERTP